jgi:hypothetical protein
VDRLTTIAHRLDLGGHGVRRSRGRLIIGRLQRPKRPKASGWSIEDHQAIADLEEADEARQAR